MIWHSFLPPKSRWNRNCPDRANLCSILLSSPVLTRSQGWMPKKAQGAAKQDDLPCMSPNSVKLVNDLKCNMWLASTSQHYLFKAQMLPFFIKTYYSSPNFAWCKFQNNGNFARNGAPELLMKLKQQNKYEKYDCVLFIIVKQSWEWYLLCLTVAQANSTICGISRANKMWNVLSATIFF